MHDVVAHSWAVVAAQADGARYALAQDPQRAEQSLEVIADTARHAIGDLRSLVARLRDPATATDHAAGDTAYGLASAGPERQADLLARMRASGMTLDVIEHGSPGLSDLVGLTAHRLLAESLTNALKHGDLRKPVAVEQDWRSGYRLRVTNAVGERSDHGTGHGILGMIERCGLAGGVATSRSSTTRRSSGPGSRWSSTANPTWRSWARPRTVRRPSQRSPPFVPTSS
jgi:signal transduction histidine kinase